MESDLKPLSYYWGLGEEHPDYQLLTALVKFYGEYFQKCHLFTLKYLLIISATSQLEEISSDYLVNPVSNEFNRLSVETKFILIPFLHQLIAARKE